MSKEIQDQGIEGYAKERSLDWFQWTTLSQRVAEGQHAYVKALWVVLQQREIISNHVVKNIILLTFLEFLMHQGGGLRVMLLTSLEIIAQWVTSPTTTWAHLVLFSRALPWSHTRLLDIPWTPGPFHSQFSCLNALPRIPFGSLSHFLQVFVHISFYQWYPPWHQLHKIITPSLILHTF